MRDECLHFLEAARADDRSDGRDETRGHGKAAQSEPDEHPGKSRVSGHVTAHGDWLAPPLRAVDGALEQAENGRMERVVEMCDVFVLPVGGERVLDEVVGSDAEEARALS